MPQLSSTTANIWGSDHMDLKNGVMPVRWSINGRGLLMQTVYCTACGGDMSVAAIACPKCGHPNNSQAVNSASGASTTSSGFSAEAIKATPKIEFGQAVKTFFQKYADFKGRARRSEFWFAYLFTVIVALPLSILDAAANGPEEFGFLTFLQLAWNLAILIPFLAVSSRRLHDTNTSFGYFWLILIPLVGIILLIVKWAEDGTAGPNRFGPSTKYF
jgi:uncharacterized membrane protein YhaH (DUF805 family)